jgi:hypothetical protein
MFTSTISCGLDFSPEEPWFHEAFLMLTNSGCTERSMMQMLGRCRCFIDKQIVVNYAEAKGDSALLPTDHEDVRRNLVGMEQLLRVFDIPGTRHFITESEELRDLQAFNIQERNMSTNAALPLFMARLQHAGVEVMTYDSKQDNFSNVERASLEGSHYLNIFRVLVDSSERLYRAAHRVAFNPHYRLPRQGDQLTADERDEVHAYQLVKYFNLMPMEATQRFFFTFSDAEVMKSRMEIFTAAVGAMESGRNRIVPADVNLNVDLAFETPQFLKATLLHHTLRAFGFVGVLDTQEIEMKDLRKEWDGARIKHLATLCSQFVKAIDVTEVPSLLRARRFLDKLLQLAGLRLQFMTNHHGSIISMRISRSTQASMMELFCARCRSEEVPFGINKQACLQRIPINHRFIYVEGVAPEPPSSDSLLPVAVQLPACLVNFDKYSCWDHITDEQLGLFPEGQRVLQARRAHRTEAEARQEMRLEHQRPLRRRRLEDGEYEAVAME